MKTYTFTCTSGYIGGSGVVKAKTKQRAVELANEVIASYGINGQPITEKELKEIKGEGAVLITNGDY